MMTINDLVENGYTQGKPHPSIDVCDEVWYKMIRNAYNKMLYQIVVKIYYHLPSKEQSYSMSADTQLYRDNNDSVFYSFGIECIEDMSLDTMENEFQILFERMQFIPPHN